MGSSPASELTLRMAAGAAVARSGRKAWLRCVRASMLTLRISWMRCHEEVRAESERGEVSRQLAAGVRVCEVAGDHGDAEAWMGFGEGGREVCHFGFAPGHEGEGAGVGSELAGEFRAEARAGAGDDR
jgi:hypothetical protein